MPGLDYFLYSSILICVTNAAVGLFTLYAAPKGPLKTTLLLLFSSVSIWMFFWFLWLKAGTLEEATLYFSLLSVGSNLGGPATFHFIALFTKSRVPKFVHVLNWFALLLVNIVSVSTDWVADRFAPVGPIPFYPRANFFLPVVIAWHGLNSSSAFYMMFRAFKRPQTAQERQQLKWVVTGLTFAWICGLFTYVGFYDLQIPPWPIVLILAYPASFAYALVRHKMLDVEVVLRKTAVFSGLFAATAAIVGTLNYWLPKALFSTLGMNVGGYWFTVVTFTATFYVLRGIRERLINLTDNYLFQKPVDHPVVMTNIARIAFKLTNTNRLAEFIVSEVGAGLRLKGCAVYLKNPKKNTFALAARQGNLEDESPPEFTTNPIVEFLESAQQAFGSTLHPPARRVPSPCALHLDRTKARFCIPLLNFHELQGYLLLGEKQSDEIYDPDDYDQLVPLGRMISVTFSNAFLKEELETAQRQVEEAKHDSLTGVLVRSAFFDRCEMEAVRARRFGSGFAILMIDLDHFKKKNDTLGHPGGDQILREAARRIAGSLREQDFVGRYGGEEFIVFLHGVSIQDAETVAERIRRRLAGTPILVDGKPVAQTASIGGAICPIHASKMDELIEIADRCLYEAKEGGRNQVRLAKEESLLSSGT